MVNAKISKEELEDRIAKKIIEMDGAVSREGAIKMLLHDLKNEEEVKNE